MDKSKHHYRLCDKKMLGFFREILLTLHVDFVVMFLKEAR